jgi:hypothetical protein
LKIGQEAITIGQEEGGRPASSRNQILGTIVYSRVSKIQHNDGQWAGLISRDARFGHDAVKVASNWRLHLAGAWFCAPSAPEEDLLAGT